MEAQRLASRTVLCIALLLAPLSLTAWGKSARTQNFIVTAATQPLADEICAAAEKFRSDLAIEWLGAELPNWEQPCPITVQVDPKLGAGGATSFLFSGGHPHGWTMNIQGSRERVLDSVLPHEVTHTIFATHFGRPLPRWADEGACTTVEHASERGKQEKLLYQFLTTNRGIAFNRMFAMKEYPSDILPLYSQGYALARYLIALGGKRKFVEYVGTGMDSNNWTAATKKFYGFHSLSDLQLSWLEWVRKGTPEIKNSAEVLYVSTDPARNGRTLAQINGEVSTTLVAANTTSEGRVIPANPLPVAKLAPANGETLVAMAESKQVDRRANADPYFATSTSTPLNTLSGESENKSTDGWYTRRRNAARARGDGQTAATDNALRTPPPDEVNPPTRAQPAVPRQSILQWRKDEAQSSTN